MVREAYDDYHRHKADAKENNAPVKRFHNGRLEDDRVVSVPVNSGKTSPEKESNDGKV